MFIVIAENTKGGFGVPKEFCGYMFVHKITESKTEALQWNRENLEVREITREEYEFKKGTRMDDKPGNKFNPYN